MKDYWKFRAIIESFKATGYGKIITHGGYTWRKRGSDYVLLDPPSGIPSVPEDAGRIRSLSWCNSIPASVPRKKQASHCYYVADPCWNGGSQGVRAEKKAYTEGLSIKYTIDKEGLLVLLDKWMADKKEYKPSTMVVRGHYASMIECGEMTFLGFYLGGELIGAIGYAIEGREAVIGFAKHGYGPWWLSKAMWTIAVRKILETAGSVNCGDTADSLKKSLNMQRMPQYKVDFELIRKNPVG